MIAPPVVIELCPQPLVASGLTLLMRDMPVEHRQAFISAIGQEEQPGLFVARQSQTVLGACWGQAQPGNTAIFWPPQVADSAGAELSDSLAKTTVADLDRRGCGLSQALLNERNDPVALLLENHHFSYLAELLYLGVKPDATDRSNTADCLEFQPFQLSEIQQSTEIQRLKTIIQRTYQQTMDCPDLDGARPMDDVIAGYLATGSFDPDLWMFIRHEETDVGVLLLTTHPENGNWELVYMGLTPEIRGKSWGLEVVRHAKRLAAAASVEQLVLAVDAANRPAVKMYEMAGFTAWDRRHVMVRLPQAG